MSENTTATPWLIHIDCPKSYIGWGSSLMILLIILFLNGSIIFVLVRKHRPFSVANILVLHLSVADFWYVLTPIPYGLAVLARSPLASTFFCQLNAFTARFTYCSSIYLITVLSTCRCYSILQPFRHRVHIYPSRVNKICLGAWCLSLVFALTPFFGWGEYQVIDGQCWCNFDAHKYPYNWFVFLVLFYALPTMINTVIFVSTAKAFMTRKNLVTTRSQKKDKPDISSWTTLFSEKTRKFIVPSDGVQGVFKNKDPNETCHQNETPRIQEADDFKSTCETKVNMNNQGIGPSHGPKGLPHLHQPKSKPSTQSENNTQLQTINKIEVDVQVHINNSDIEKHVRRKLFYVNPTNQPENHNNLQMISQPQSQRASKLKIQTETHLQCIDERESKVTENNNDVDKHGTQEKHPTYSRKEEERIPSKKLSLNKTVKKDFKVLIVVLLFASFVLFCSPTFIVRTFYAINFSDI